MSRFQLNSSKSFLIFVFFLPRQISKILFNLVFVRFVSLSNNDDEKQITVSMPV